MRNGTAVGPGGLDLAVSLLDFLGATAGQLMTKDPKSYMRGGPVPREEIYAATAYTDADKELLIHATLYATLTKEPNDRKQILSNNSLIEDLKISAQFGGRGVVVHPGQMKDEEQILNAIAACSYIAERMPDGQTLLLENAVHGLHQTLLPLKAIIDRATNPSALGICLDTAHMYAASLDLSDENHVQIFVEPFADYICAVHFNNSRQELGSKRDGHGALKDGFMTYDKVEKMYRLLRTILPDVPFVIEGTLDKEEIDDLHRWGADVQEEANRQAQGEDALVESV